MALSEFLAKLGDEVVHVDEETFDLFSQTAALPNLGMIDAKAETLEITIGAKDYTITQSPGLLQSSHEQGTTGAVVWQSSVRVAEWLADPRSSLFNAGLFDHDSTVLELGSGISGIVATVLAAQVKAVVATDQQHVLRLLRSNIDANAGHRSDRKSHGGRKASKVRQPSSSIQVIALDWEEDDVQRHLASNDLRQGVDVVIACDCIFNYALINPLVQTCEDICKLRSEAVTESNLSAGSTVCLVAQQLRQSEVFEQWLKTFMRSFRVWRLPDNMLSGGLQEGSGFVVHVGVLREKR
ncbi:Ribosomal protein lysine methyltransferase [Recurvomyces mirabilis]|uniref:Ribosomal protein lysine methyltransferase n=1 Tax=Recurvomyces mirabilis TaxID=574656 RepID=A0AAE1C4Z7_9PEZI|nr:Ribosomal protein lysine methyltransferase [Recurvomyces mirabilis]KAK5151831.1 Ribosomal protein lysine methyltransferase [Recurvomyces mirabilis]